MRASETAWLSQSMGAGWQTARARCVPLLMGFLMLLPVPSRGGGRGGGGVVNAEKMGQPPRLAVGFQALRAGDLGRLAGTRLQHFGHRPPAPLLLGRAVGGVRKPAASAGARDAGMLRPGPARAHGAREGGNLGLLFARGPLVALRDLVLFLAELFALAAKRLGHVVASLAVMMALSAPLPVSAASICIPVPTPSGIARLCVDVGEASSPKSQEGLPEHVNAQRTPRMSEGNVLSRAGIRPLAMFSDAQAKIKAVAKQRLQFIDHIEAGPRTEPETQGPARRRELMDKRIDGVALSYGDTNTPRSVIIADQIDPVFVMIHLALAGTTSRNPAARKTHAHTLVGDGRSAFVGGTYASPCRSGPMACDLGRYARADFLG